MAFASILIGTAPALAGEEVLEMYILNAGGETLYFASESEVDDYPSIIPPGANDLVVAKESSGGHLRSGTIVYTNNSVSTQATCSATLSFQYEYNSLSGHCDKKSFTPTTTGDCTLARSGDCYGPTDCKCNFTYTSAATQ